MNSCVVFDCQEYKELGEVLFSIVYLALWALVYYFKFSIMSSTFFFLLEWESYMGREG